MYVTTTSTRTVCVMSNWVIIDTSTSVALVGSYLTVDASGNLKVDTNTIGKKTVKMRYDYGGATFTNTNQFVATVGCPALTTPTFTPATPYQQFITVSAPVKTQILAGSTYVTTSSSSVQCPLTFQIIEGGSTYSGTFLEITTTGNLKIDTNQRLSKTIKLQWKYFYPDPLTLATAQTA
jgi:hypothetical protein